MWPGLANCLGQGGICCFLSDVPRVAHLDWTGQPGTHPCRFIHRKLGLGEKHTLFSHRVRPPPCGELSERWFYCLEEAITCGHILRKKNQLPQQLPAALEAAPGAEVMASVEVEIQDWCNAKGCFFQTQSELQLQPCLLL